MCACTYLFVCLLIQISPPNFPAQRIYPGWFFRHSRDVVMEQVKQTFDISLSLSFWQLLRLNQSLCALVGNVSPSCSPWWTNRKAEWTWMLIFFFSRFAHCEKCGAFVRFDFKFFANNLKLERESSLSSRVHYENEERALNSLPHTYADRDANVNIRVCVCPPMCNTRGLFGCCLKSTTIRIAC